jgi:hypothetical protein
VVGGGSEPVGAGGAGAGVGAGAGLGAGDSVGADPPQATSKFVRVIRTARARMKDSLDFMKNYFSDRLSIRRE